MCRPKLQMSVTECPMCRTGFDQTGREQFQMLHTLVHGRGPGRHTPAAQCTLGLCYANGTGVVQDDAEAVQQCLRLRQQCLRLRQ